MKSAESGVRVGDGEGWRHRKGGEALSGWVSNFKFLTVSSHVTQAGLYLQEFYLRHQFIVIVLLSSNASSNLRYNKILSRKTYFLDYTETVASVKTAVFLKHDEKPFLQSL